MKRHLIVAAAALSLSLSACSLLGGVVDAAGEKVCPTLNAIKSQVATATESNGDKTAGDALAGLDAIEAKLETAKADAGEPGKVVIDRIESAITAASEPLTGVAPDTAVKDVPGVAEKQAKVKEAYDSVYSELKCS